MSLNTNYGFPPPYGYSSPYSSTPTGIRAQRPRFGYSGLSMYPRPRMSASDTESFSDSMVNNYGTSTSRFDTTLNSENKSSYNDSFDSSGSKYYSANNTFSHGQSYGETSMIHSDYSLRENGDLPRNDSVMYKGQNMMRGGFSRDNSMIRENQNMMRFKLSSSNSTMLGGGYSGFRAPPYSETSNSGFLSKGISQFDASKYNTTFGMASTEFKGTFQKKFNFGDRNNKSYFPRKRGRPPKMAATKESSWKCKICTIEFTSEIPYDMHLRGAKHAKKIKANQALKSVLEAEQAANTFTSQDDKKSFFCELCNVKANSSLQLQTHLEGTKHKSKLQPKETISQSETQEGSKDSTSTSVDVKTNGSLVRPLPSDFGEPQLLKLAKYACEICNIAVNSEIQLQQHLTSKKHYNKVEGKPLTKERKVRKESEENDTSPETEKAEEEAPMDSASNETSTKVIGVKTLASSFVQGETLQ